LIYGIGVDIVVIERIENMIQKWGEAFFNKIFTEQEKKYCLQKKNKIQCFAGRFAAKEAFLKAFKNNANFREIEIIIKDRIPCIKLLGKTKRLFEKLLNKGKIYLSISHDGGYAIAMVVIEEER